MTNPKIQNLRSKATTKVTIKDENLGEVEWIIRSIPAYDLLQNYDIFQGLPSEVKMDPENMQPDDIKLIKTKILPMMEVVVPICVVDPPVTVVDNDPRLANDEEFYVECSNEAKKNFNNLYTEEIFLNKMKKINEK